MLMKMSRFDFLASSRASGPHICHATGLFMCPRTYGLRLSFRRFVSFSPSPLGASAVGRFCASIASIDAWSLRSCARGRDRAVAGRWAVVRRVGAVTGAVWAEAQDPLSLNFTVDIQQRKCFRALSPAHVLAESGGNSVWINRELSQPRRTIAPPPPWLRNHRSCYWLIDYPLNSMLSF
jgi:hypothetical protein